MSLHPCLIKPVPEQTAQIAHAAFPKALLNRFFQHSSWLYGIILGLLLHPCSYSSRFTSRNSKSFKISSQARELKVRTEQFFQSITS
jgi:hypothetical protein